MKPGISRRAFLGGAGAAIALPFLESLWPRRAGAAPTPPKRFLAYYVPCGIVMKDWTPPGMGGINWPMTPILQPIAALRSKVTIITGLSNRAAIPDGPGDHASGTAAFLTARHPYKTDGVNIKNGISVDQAAAGVLGAKSPFPSLQLGIDGGTSVGGCDSGYSCAYARNISWAGDATPLPKLVNPQAVFDRLFAGTDALLSPEEKARRLKHKTSVLDFVTADAQRLQSRLGSTDRKKVDEYLTGVRALETRLQTQGNMCNAGARPPDNFDYPAQVALMTDLMALAFQCDQTRVASFMLGNAGSNRTYDHIGVPDAHHELSHHMGDAGKLAKLTKIDTWEVQQLADLLAKLDKIDEGGSSVLDNSLVFFSGEIEDGNTHSHLNMPVLVAGKAGGALAKAAGKQIVYSQERSFGDLFLTFLMALGVPGVTSFGDNGKAPLGELLG